MYIGVLQQPRPAFFGIPNPDPVDTFFLDPSGE
jgi:hypothetical protein